MLNWLYKWYDPQGRLSIQQVAEQLTEMALGGIAADKPNTPGKHRRAVRTPAPAKLPAS
jgi:tetracycline repressor-like protein